MKTDLELKRNVQSNWLWHPLVAQARVGVAVSDGVVTWSAPGVRRVHSELAVEA